MMNPPFIGRFRDVHAEVDNVDDELHYRRNDAAPARTAHDQVHLTVLEYHRRRLGADRSLSFFDSVRLAGDKPFCAGDISAN